jgi:YhcN/YlaJ family sporulation lipoprotein
MLPMRRLFTLILVGSLAATGCQMNDNQARQQEDKQQGTNVQQEQRVPETTQNNNNRENNNQNAHERAERLVNIATKVPQVNDATAIVMGNVAIIGIDVNAKLDRPRVGTIKYTVAEALKKDPQGANALVTSDPDIVQRLREMNQDIQNGRPLAGFAEELADIAGRIIPQLPNDVEDKKEIPSPNQNK